MTFLALIAIIFFGFAVYNLTCAFVDIPTKKTSQMMMLSRKQQGTKNEKLLDVYVTKIAGWIAPYLRLDRLKRNKVQRALDIACLQLTPEVYTARAWVTAGEVGLCAIPMAFLIPLLVPILIGLAVALWFSTYYAAFDFVKKRRKLIEGEIPRFALTVGQSLENDRDVLKILTSYRRVAGKDFGAELDQTIADMKTGNYENALIRFETRIGSPMLSDVIRGLIGVLRGDDQRMYFKMITFDMRQIEQNNLKKEAAKRNSIYTIAMEEMEPYIADLKTVEDEVEARELALMIQCFLDTLTLKERVIFMRRYAYMDTYRDIAKRVGISEKNVSVRLSLIRQKMRKYLMEREVSL